MMTHFIPSTLVCLSTTKVSNKPVKEKNCKLEGEMAATKSDKSHQTYYV